MKKMLWGLALFLCSGSALLAQSFPGTWQGALKVPQAPNGELRVVVKISTTAADKLAADFYSIDQRTPAIPATALTTNGNNFKMTIERVNGLYEGKMSADGKTINGTWTQQGNSLPLDLTRATPETAWTIPEPPPPPKMMEANAQPEFEVATIKPSDPSRPGWGITVNPSGVLRTLNTTVNDLIKFGFDMHPKQVVGAPSWADSEKFDIEAKPDKPGMPSVKQLKGMVQKLLAERFSLASHKDKKELSAYAITAMKNGVKIKKE
ncbi:MAG: TIGR03435 family protein [Acidobacteria bacterium]|nr:TIGR03435 family protein [Acidobacteriota bacterium]